MTGNLVVLLAVYSSSSLLRPKSAILHCRDSLTRTLRAARSLCIKPWGSWSELLRFVTSGWWGCSGLPRVTMSTKSYFSEKMTQKPTKYNYHLQLLTHGSFKVSHSISALCSHVYLIFYFQLLLGSWLS